MSLDITTRRASETAKIPLKDGEGAPLCDENGEQVSVTVCGPGSKTWQRADAERSRRRTKRLEKNGGKLSAALDGAPEDEIDFLVAITVSFDGWHYPAPEGDFPTKAAMFEAAYSDDTIGYIRDQVHREANDWAAFTKG